MLRWIPLGTAETMCIGHEWLEMIHDQEMPQLW